MTPKERILAALQKREPDRVPVGEAYVDYPIVEHVIGRETFYRSHARETFALWEGRRDELVDGQKRDLVEFVHRVGLDIVPVNLLPPRNQAVDVPRRIGVDTWESRSGDVLRCVPETGDLVVLHQGTLPVEPVEQPTPDGSEWELWDYVVEQLGDTHFLFAPGGISLGIRLGPDINSRSATFEDWMMRLMAEPEKIAEEQVRAVQGYRHAAAELAARGADGLKISPDFGYGRATYCSPELFRLAFVPAMIAACDEIHAAGLKVVFHCDSNMSEVTDALVEAQVDIYHSIDPHEPIERYKREIGDRVTLWGGINCHDLCAATPDQIRERARAVIRDCGPGGGFVLGTSHNLLPGTRYENLMAMLDVATGVSG